MSPSTRRAWIEITPSCGYRIVTVSSPSTRRAWIEIVIYRAFDRLRGVALHPEGVDRNTGNWKQAWQGVVVALHSEGVDRNFSLLKGIWDGVCRPPLGGRG